MGPHMNAGSWQLLAPTASFLLIIAALPLAVHPQGPGVPPPELPPPPPANTFFSRSLGTNVPLEGAVVGAVVGGTVLAILLWFSVRYCCFFGRSSRFLSMEMTATRRHEREQQRQQEHRRHQHHHLQLQQQEELQQRRHMHLHIHLQGACQHGTIGVPEAVFSQFPLREFSQAGHTPSSKLKDPAPVALPPAPHPPPPSPAPWRWRLPLFSSPSQPDATHSPQELGTSGSRTPDTAAAPPAPGAQLHEGPTPRSPSVVIALEPHPEAPQCPICLSDFKHGIMLRRLPCAHEFHQTCIDSWMMQHRTCPLCRLTLYAQQQQEGSLSLAPAQAGP